jgi:putative membrane protein
MVQGELGRRFVKNVLSMFAGDREWLVFGAIDDLFAQLDALYANRGDLIRSVTWHLVGWFVGAIEVFVVLNAMGHPLDFGDAVIIESLMHAVRGASFAIPGALGAQEGGLIVLCAIFGIPPEAALALSLVKRIPDLVIGVPGLLAWQAMEGWHFHGGRRPPADNQNERA